MRRFSLVPLAAVAALTFAPAAHGATRANWNRDEQQTVAAAGLLTRLDDHRFHGERDLTGAQLGQALTVLAGVPVAATSSDTVSVTAFDARLVGQLGLTDVATHVHDTARQAGLTPPRTFGTEVV